MSSGFLDTAMPAVTALGDNGAVWIAAALIFISLKRYRANGITLLIALFLCVLVGNMWLKPMVARIRPFDVNPAVSLLIARPSDYSFPSAHTMTSVAAATVIFFGNRRIGAAAGALAAAIAFSRLYLYVHYLSDVLAGALIGAAIGIFSVFASNKVIKKVCPDCKE